MVGVKAYQDGDRTIIMIENCKGEIKRKTAHFISDLMGLSDDAPEEMILEPIEDLEPLPPEDESLPEIEVMEEVSPEEMILDEYADTSVQEVYERNGMKDVVQLYSVTDDNSVKADCQAYIYDDLYMRKKYLSPEHDLKRKELFTLVTDYEMLLGDFVKNEILNHAGFADIETFARKAPASQVRDAFEVIIEKLQAEQC